MIPVKKQPEPRDFYQKVQKKGEKILAQNPHPRGKQLKPYWRDIVPELYHAYSGICAYTCHWISEDTGSKTVEHFKPKDFYPELAYSWDNYRLVCGTLNGRKGNKEDVLDPFTLQDGWFVLHFPSLQVKPGDNLTRAEAESVMKTIKRLKLNDETCIRGRTSWLKPYILGKYGIDHLEEKAPFLACELKRQNIANIDHAIWEDFKKYLQNY